MVTTVVVEVQQCEHVQVDSIAMMTLDSKRLSALLTFIALVDLANQSHAISNIHALPELKSKSSARMVSMSILSHRPTVVKTYVLCAHQVHTRFLKPWAANHVLQAICVMEVLTRIPQSQ